MTVTLYIQNFHRQLTHVLQSLAVALYSILNGFLQYGKSNELK